MAEVEALERMPRQQPETGIWRWREALPAVGDGISLGEGETPLVRISCASPRLFAKLESLNPTLSFKDRALALATSLAVDRGREGLVLASTGSTAVSAAAYAARAGLSCRIFVGDAMSLGGRVSAARAHGADVEVVPGDYSDAYAAATCAEHELVFNVTTTYRNPFQHIAYRTIAYELHQELGRAPDAIFVPVGAGPLLRGVLEGFDDLRQLGEIPILPRMIGVQAAACAPLVRAYEASDPLRILRQEWPIMPTSAGAIADPMRGYEEEGLLTLEAVRRSHGAMHAVTEAEIRDALIDLAVDDGLLVDPAAAAAVAAARSESGLTKPDDIGVVLITGHGDRERGSSHEPQEIPA